MSRCLLGVAFPPGAEALFDLLQPSKDVSLLLVGHLPVGKRILVSVNRHGLELFVWFCTSPRFLDFDVAPILETWPAGWIAWVVPPALGEFALDVERRINFFEFFEINRFKRSGGSALPGLTLSLTASLAHVGVSGCCC